MIPKKYRAFELEGRKCRPVKELKNGAGLGITKDTICTIESAHYGITIKTAPCPCCGQFCRISRIPREDLELIEGEY